MKKKLVGCIPNAGKKCSMSLLSTFIERERGKERERNIVSWWGVVQLGGLLLSYHEEVPLRLRLVSLLYHVFCHILPLGSFLHFFIWHMKISTIFWSAQHSNTIKIYNNEYTKQQYSRWSSDQARGWGRMRLSGKPIDDVTKLTLRMFITCFLTGESLGERACFLLFPKKIKSIVSGIHMVLLYSK